MKTGKTLQELAVELERQNSSKRDFVAPGAMLTAKSNGHTVLSIADKGSFELNVIAHEQMADRLGIPRKYYDEMKASAPALLDQNINHWLRERRDGGGYLVRTMDNRVRALLTEKYRPLDNYDLAQVALPALMETGCKVESCEVTDSRMYLKAVTPKITREVVKGDIVQAGIIISNSEVGKGALSIQPLVHRLVCMNGLIVNDAKMRKSHVGRGITDMEGAQEFYRTETRIADDKAFWLKVRDTIAAALSEAGFESYVNRLAELKQNKIEGDPMKVIELVQKRYALAENEKGGVLRHLIEGADLSQYGLVNAVTRFAQDVDSYDRSTEFEKIGGQIVELNRTEWQVISQAA